MIQTNHLKSLLVALNCWITLFVLLGFGLFAVNLTVHRSQSPKVFGIYSTSYTVFLLVLMVVLVGAAALLFRYQERVSARNEGLATRLPITLLHFIAVVTVTVFTWIWLYPPFEVFASIWTRLGLVALLFGLCLLLISRVLVTNSKHSIADAIWAVMITCILIGLYVRTTNVSVLEGSLLLLFGPPAGYGLVLVSERLMNTFARNLAQAQHWFATQPAGITILMAALAAYIGLVYQGELAHALFNGDEVRLINFVRNRSFWESISEILNQSYFRPIFQAETYLFYKTFGLNYSVYVSAQLFFFGLSAVALTFVFTRLSGSLFFAGALSLLFTSHIFASSVVSIWAIDAITLLGLLTGLVMYLIATWRFSRLRLMILLSLLLVSSIARENGLALIAGVGGADVFDASISKRRNIKQLAWLLLGLISVVVIYFGLRWMWLGSPLPSRFFTETCFGSQFYTGPEISSFAPNRQWLVAGYTILANFTAQFAPAIYNDDGCMQVSRYTFLDWLGPSGLVALAIVAGLVADMIADKHKQLADIHKVARIIVTPIILCGLGPLMLLWIVKAPVLIDATLAMLLLHTFISLFVISILVFRAKHSRTSILIIGFCAGILLSTPVLTMFYFRYRNLYLPLIAWLALIALCFRLLRGQSRTRPRPEAPAARNSRGKRESRKECAWPNS